MKENITTILFGSRAKGTANEHSDADVGVISEHVLSDDERLAVVETSADRLSLSEDAIDLIELSKASPLLQYQAAKEGRLLLGDKKKWIRFRVLAWKRYLSTAKFRRMRERSLAQKYA